MRFDIDIKQLSTATGTVRSQLVSEQLSRLEEQVVTDTAILVDRNGTAFGWLFPDLLSVDEHVSFRSLLRSI